MFGPREGLDLARMIVVTGMVALSFKTAPWQILHALGWILLLVSMVRERRWTVPGPPRWAIPWAAFAGWVLLASALGPDPGEALHDSKKLLNLLAVFLIGAVLRDAGDGLRMVSAVCAVSSLLAVFGLYQYAVSPDHLAYRSEGVSHHMTHAGMLMVTLSLVLPHLRLRRRIPDLLLWGYTMLGSAALLATLTRSAWLGMAAALVVVIGFRNPRGLILLPVGMVLILAVVPDLRGRALSLLDVREDYSAVQRWSIYRAGLRMVADHPLTGVGGRDQVKGQYARYAGTPPQPPPTPDGSPPVPYPRPYHLHDNLLQIAAAFGLPALLAWLVALGAWLRQLLRVLPRREEAPAGPEVLRRDVLVGALAAGTAFLTMGMLEYNFGDSEVFALFALVLAIPFALDRARRPTAVLPG
jgi:O-antigen ligase